MRISPINLNAGLCSFKGDDFKYNVQTNKNPIGEYGPATETQGKRDALIEQLASLRTERATLNAQLSRIQTKLSDVETRISDVRKQLEDLEPAPPLDGLAFGTPGGFGEQSGHLPNIG